MGKVKIQGMSCRHCLAAVSQALNKIGGLKEVKVGLEKGEASFENERQVSREKISLAIAEAGFKTAL